MIMTIAAQQVTVLRRQRVFLVLLGTLLAMTALAGVIGWSSQATIGRVFDESVKLLAERGAAAPPNPFGLRPPLALLSNMAIYVPLIGALLAIVLGHLSLADDQSTGIGRLIFTRRLSRTGYLLGKLLGTATMIAAVLLASAAVSVVSLVVVNGALPVAADLGRLLAFYTLAWLYMMFFALVGMVAVLLTRRRSLALLGALGVWLVLTFAVPQITSGLRPTASLNPLNEPVSTSQPFFALTAQARPLSVGEGFKNAAAAILQTAPAQPLFDTVVLVLPLLAATAALALLTTALVGRHDYSASAADE